MDEMQKAAWEIAKKHIKPMLLEELELILIPALKKAVAESENKYDDAFVAMIEKPLMDAIKQQIGQI